MKKLIFALLLVVMAFNSSVFAQNGGEEVKKVIVKVFDLSKAKNYEEISGYLAYTGDDKARQYKAPMDIKNKDEKSKIRRIANRIEAFLDISDKYEIASVSTANREGQEWYLVKVKFLSGGQTLDTEFAFVKAGSKYLLGDFK